MIDTQRLLVQLGITQLPHPACSPDLAPNDFWFYPCLKHEIRGMRFPSLNALEEAVHDQIADIAYDEYRECMLVKWPRRWRKCLEFGGHFFEGMQ